MDASTPKAERTRIAKKAARTRKRKLNIIAKREFKKKYDELPSSRKKKIRLLYKKQKKEKKTPKKPSQKKDNKERAALISGKHIRIIKCTFRKNGKICGKLVEEGNLKRHMAQHKGAGTASQRNIQSEKQYFKKLKKQYPNSLLFKTGKEIGVPDIVLFTKSKLSFYEIKPTKEESEKGSRLKETQVKWIKKNCLAKRNEAYIVFYKGPTSKLSFSKKLLTRKNIDKYG